VLETTAETAAQTKNRNALELLLEQVIASKSFLNISDLIKKKSNEKKVNNKIFFEAIISAASEEKNFDIYSSYKLSIDKLNQKLAKYNDSVSNNRFVEVATQ
jgi:hypothetical protein